MNSLPKTVTRQRRGCDLNPGPSAPESSTLTTRLPSHKLMIIIQSNLNRISKNVTKRFLGKFAVNWLLKVSPPLAYVAALPCETLTSENKRLTIDNKASAATYLRCGGVVRN